MARRSCPSDGCHLITTVLRVSEGEISRFKATEPGSDDDYASWTANARPGVVLTTTRSYEPNWKVHSAEEAAGVFVANGGRIVAGPDDIPIGQVVAVEDPFGNVLVLLDSTKGTYRTDDEGNVTGVA
jgi:predicted enzyme related to lactoylglutathione lyase